MPHLVLFVYIFNNLCYKSVLIRNKNSFSQFPLFWVSDFYHEVDTPGRYSVLFNPCWFALATKGVSSHLHSDTPPVFSSSDLGSDCLNYFTLTSVFMITYLRNSIQDTDLTTESGLYFKWKYFREWKRSKSFIDPSLRRFSQFRRRICSSYSLGRTNISWIWREMNL